MDLELGRVGSESAQQLMAVLDRDDDRLGRGEFSLVGSVDPATGRLEDQPALVKNLGNDQWMVFQVDEAELERIVKADIAQLREGVGMDAGGVNVSAALAIAEGLLETSAIPGAGILSSPAIKIAEPVAEIAKGVLGFDGKGEVGEIARELRANGVTSSNVQKEAVRSTFLRQSPEFAQAMQAAPSVDEELGGDSPELSSFDSARSEGENAPLLAAGRDAIDLPGRGGAVIDRAESAELPDGVEAANETVGSRYVGPIESIDDRFVIQRVDDELVAHRAEEFDISELPRDGGLKQIIYEHDGPSILDVVKELGLELGR